MNKKTRIEIFCGTGGVGKTTLATSRAIHLSSKNENVLLMTIDPSKRLKQVLQISDDDDGKEISVNIQESSLTALLLSPKGTFLKTINELKNKAEIDNRILQVLLKPYGGLHEILALVELSRQQRKNTFDVIVLDTPPGSHLLDFLSSGERINSFFNKSFVEVVTHLNKKSKSIFQMAIKTGISKLMGVLEQVTGKDFVDDFLEAVESVYILKNDFLHAAKLPNDLKNDEMCKWFLVTSLNQKKIKQAEKLKEEISQFSDENLTFLLNQSLELPLSSWDPKTENQKKLKKLIKNKENEIVESAKGVFSNIILFPEVVSSAPQEHLKALSQNWKDHESR